MLAQMLDFKSLDRLQINNAATIRDLVIDRQVYGIRAPELPFLFHQRVLPDGRIEARTPAGTAVHVDVVDVCDVIQGQPMLVRAMTKRSFLDRLSLPLEERGKPPGDECFHPAYVMWVSKDRWGHVDARVWFVDEALNADAFNSPYFIAPLHQGDRAAVQAAARRTRMPVQCVRFSGGVSADQGVRAAGDLARAVVAGFMRSSLKGAVEAAKTLSMCGAAPIKRAELNRLIGGPVSNEAV
ncbi:hypothetical protein [Ralstonia sp. ASV6]|uniref:hypothetical protein n=1 Tax=Ralstonia sp. ASV6 TaxID=2795124 RepID=UPI0018EC843B|nr:hypothetical protein [Ralstonia sp. ASV6]